MTRTHTHREGGPTCRFATKKECDENWKQVMQVLKDKHTEEELAAVEKHRAERIARFDAFIEQEWERMNSYD